MGDAEDVLLDAAAHVGAATRALWRRNTDPRREAEQRAAAAERRVATWAAALGHGTLALTPWDAPPAPGWLARLLGRPAPWQERPLPTAWSDGAQLFLPRPRLEGESMQDRELLLLAALAQGQRVARGRHAQPAECALARDVSFALDAALGDAELAAALPGLVDALARARATALATRPARERLLPAERAVEDFVRALLETPLSRLARDLDAFRVTACALAERHAAQSGGYRGVAPVEHWGTAAPAHAPARTVTAQGRTAPARRARAHDLERSVRRRAADEADADTRPGPFVLPHGDPHLALQDARGVVRPEDRGDEDAGALADELGRIGELPTVRSEGEVREILVAGQRRSGPRAAGAISSDPREPVFSYPEWDASRSSYRNPGIVLREITLPLGDTAWASRVRNEQRPLLALLRRHFEALRPRRERVGRQLDGDTLDVHGAVAEHAERRAGLSPEGRVYGRERPLRRDVAVALLVDASGSTDAWVSRGERVIDVAKHAALCFGEALTALGDRHAVYAFSGHGPSDVRVAIVKRFHEPWSESTRARLCSLQPDRSTRLGGPIRHVTAQLARQMARVRLLILLSDGKPDDDDAYEGSYGVEDVRQAVAEARRSGVRPFCITIDRAGASYLPHLFGPFGYTVLWDVRQLPARLPAIYRRLAGL
jgi:nitric oxide reductase NorD protein